MDYLNVHAGGVYVDATLGGGGHSSAILNVLSHAEAGSGKLFCFDADDVAITRARERFANVSAEILTLCHTNFSNIADTIRALGPWMLDGVLFDLGVSSYQFDHHERGFSYRHDAPLDMRFTPEGETAADIINMFTEEDLIRIIKEYGEDPNARKLAQAIVRRRALAPYQTTFDLRDTIVQHVPTAFQAKTLSRVFQALRIAVNDEMGRLETALRSVIPLMAVGGRIVVMSYHSLEDRIVKDVFKEYGSGRTGEHMQRSERMPRRLNVLTKKPVMASAEEVAANPRARSARLRAAEVVSE